jgi:hypothetical protein
MLNALYACDVGKLRYGEVYLDILEARANPVARDPTAGSPDPAT